MFASDFEPNRAFTNPHRAVPRSARACHDRAAFCAEVSTTPPALLRRRRPGLAQREPQRCLVAEARQG
ncbi:MAG: hypothetical protein Q7T55_12120 [Solirubrobacteraceae bacterium]|nr:hypothetical protein [Solirubrobacteraceae bacterium]